MNIAGQVTDLVESLLSGSKYFLYDVEKNGGNIKITVNAEGGVNLDELASINRQILNVLDEDDPIASNYTLEVSSPGLERKLRTEGHFHGAKGETVGIKLMPHVEGERRFKGRLDSVMQDSIVLVAESGVKSEISLRDIAKATTIFQWERNSKPGKGVSQERIYDAESVLKGS